MVICVGVISIAEFLRRKTSVGSNNMTKVLLLLAICAFVGFTSGRAIVESTPDLFAAVPINNEPMIGVLSQEISYYLDGKYPGLYNSYIAASYVKFVEGGGARVVPVWIDKPREYYEAIMSNLNGVLLPGGATWFNQSNGYAEAGRHIYDIAIEMNERGTYFPVWGTCLGFELLTYLSADGNEHRAHCSSNNQALPLEFKPDFKTSRMFNKAPEKVTKILATEAVTANFHQYCVTEKNLTDYNLDKEWRVMSVNSDWNGMEFISSIEHRYYPFYGIQFHPEKNLYEWVRNKNISHTANAIEVSQYFAEFFIDEARKNDNRFKDSTTEDKYVIYNFPPSFTGAKGSAFEQSYLFPADVKYEGEEDPTSSTNVIVGDLIEY